MKLVLAFSIMLGLALPAAAAPVELDSAALDAVTAGRWAPAEQVQRWVYDHIKYQTRNDKNRYGPWARTLSEQNYRSRITVSPGEKGSSGPRYVTLSGGNTGGVRWETIGNLQAKWGKEWRYRSP